MVDPESGGLFGIVVASSSDWRLTYVLPAENIISEIKLSWQHLLAAAEDLFPIMPARAENVQGFEIVPEGKTDDMKTTAISPPETLMSNTKSSKIYSTAKSFGDGTAMPLSRGALPKEPVTPSKSQQASFNHTKTDSPAKLHDEATTKNASAQTNISAIWASKHEEQTSRTKGNAAAEPMKSERRQGGRLEPGVIPLTNFRQSYTARMSDDNDESSDTYLEGRSKFSV